MAGRSLDHKEPTDVEKACEFCGTLCCLGQPQMELMELLGPDSFRIVGDCCLAKVVQGAGAVETYASDEIVERVKKSVGEGHSDEEDDPGSSGPV